MCVLDVAEALILSPRAARGLAWRNANMYIRSLAPPSSRPESPFTALPSSQAPPQPTSTLIPSAEPSSENADPNPTPRSTSRPPDMGVEGEQKRHRPRSVRRGRSRPNLRSQPASAPAGRLPLAEPDDYLGAPPSSYLKSSTTLFELAHLVKQKAYQEQKHTQCSQRLRKSLIATGLSARLTRSGELCHKNLVDHFKSDQKSEFATLYNAIHDVRTSCEASRRFAMLEPELNGAQLSKSSEENGEQANTSSFLEDLPQQSRETILSMLTEIRSNPSFLANRLSRLSSAELDSLVRFHHQPSPQESILPSQSNRRGATSRAPPQPQSSLPSPIERLLAFHRNDPLYTMMHSVFANTNRPDSSEDQRKLDIWSSVCVRLITENKGETVLMCVMDAWAAMREWPAAGNLEICLMRLLQEGSFLVEEDPSGKGAGTQGKHGLLAEEFWSRAERELFAVLDDEPSAGGMPEGILELGQAILSKIENPKTHRHAAMLILVKWFFNRFLANGITYPEV